MVKLKKNYGYLMLFIYQAIMLIIISFKVQEVRNGNFDHLTLLIPFEHLAFELILTFLILYPIAAIVGTMIIGYLLTPLALIIHMKIFGRKLTFGIQNYKSSFEYGLNSRAFFPVLMAVNLALILGHLDIVTTIIVYPSETIFFTYRLTFLPAFIVILVITLALSLSLFSIGWSLNDAGLIFTNKKKVEKGKAQITEQKSVGSWYQSILKGYAGIGVIFSFIEFFLIIVEEVILFPPILLGYILLVIPMPIYLMISSIPALILFNATKNGRTKFLRKIGRKITSFETIDVKIE